MPRLTLDSLNNLVLEAKKEQEEKVRGNPLPIADIDNNLLRAAVYAAYALSGKKGTLYYKQNALDMFNCQRDYVNAVEYEINVTTIYDALTAVKEYLKLPVDSYQTARELIFKDPTTAFAKAKELRIPNNIIQQAFVDYVATLQTIPPIK